MSLSVTVFGNVLSVICNMVFETLNHVFILPCFCSFVEKKCVKFYHPERQQGELLQLCKKDDTECRCAEGQ